LSQKPSVLIIKGDEISTSDIESALDSSFEAITVQTGQEGLSLFKDIHQNTKIVLMNWSLPDMPGTTLLSALRAISIIPEIIVFSQSDDSEIAITALRKGAYRFILFPFNHSILNYLITHALENIDFISKFEELSRKVLWENFDHTKRLSLAKEIIQSRQLEGKIVTEEELLSIFPIDNIHDKGREKIKSEIDPALMEYVKESDPPLILIVEDEEMLREILERTLSLIYDVVSAGSGEEALELVRREPDIDAALLDVGLPDISGTELITKIKEINPEIEAIVLTAYRDLDTIADSFRNKAADFLNKPFEDDELLSVLSKAIQKKHFREILKDANKKILEEGLSLRSRVGILKDIYEKRKDENKHLLMEDVYILFPELRESGIPDDQVMSKKIMDDGIWLFIETLKKKIEEQA
jgi:DNA-binding NtrC family response regulator